MAELVGLEAVAATCERVAEGVPVGLLAAARDQVRVALSELVDGVGSSQNPNYQRAVRGLEAMLSGIDAAHADLVAAAGHARAFRTLL